MSRFNNKDHSYKVVVAFEDGKAVTYNYIDDVEYTDHGTVILHGSEQDDGTMVSRTFIVERSRVRGVEVRAIKRK